MTNPMDANSGLLWVCPVCGTQIKYDDICPQCKTERPIIPEQGNALPPTRPQALVRSAKPVLRKRYFPWRDLFWIGLGVLMTGASILAVILAWESWYQLTVNGQDVTGQISALYLRNYGISEIEYLFKTGDGTWISGTQTVDLAIYNGLHVGVPITIRYLPTNPNESMLVGAPPAFLSGDRIPLVFGVVFFGTTTLLYIRSVRIDQRAYRLAQPVTPIPEYRERM